MKCIDFSRADFLPFRPNFATCLGKMDIIRIREGSFTKAGAEGIVQEQYSVTTANTVTQKVNFGG